MKKKKSKSAATSLRAQFRAAQAADNADFELFDSIVKNMPHEVAAFFEMFEKARANMTMPQEIAVLNAVAKGEVAAARDGGKPACLMRWFEVFRDIYIARRLAEERAGRPRGKNPNDFSTFARTFEPLALMPDFWLANDSLVGTDVRALAYPVRLAFERYLYSCAGGGAWGAMDWELGLYVDSRIYAPLRRDEKVSLRRLAALALTLRGIVTLGETASEVLTALRLRSVGRNPDKRSSMGGVGGVVLLKAGRAAQDTYDAMRCRGFDGAYRMGADVRLRPIDAVYAALFALLTILFAYTQGLV